MKNQVYFGIAIRLIILFVLGMLFTFIPDHLREFFGDTHVPDINTVIDKEWKWGARHYWFAWMMFFLFVLSVINFAVSVVNLVLKHYPELEN